MTNLATRFNARNDVLTEIEPEKHEFDEQATIAAIRNILCDNESKLPKDVILADRDPQTGQIHPGAEHGFPALHGGESARGFLAGLLSLRR